MKVKSTLLLTSSLILIWLFGDWAYYPDLRKVYRQDSEIKVPQSLGQRPAELDEPRAVLFSDINQFEVWQSETRLAYKDSLKLAAELSGSPSVRIIRSTPEKSGIVRKYFELLSGDGMRIPGVLQYPKGANNSPAVLLIPGHTKPGDSGLSQLVDEKDSYQRAAATRLAKAGYVTMTIELRGFGLLGMPNYPEHKIVAYNQLLKGSTYKALLLNDLIDSLRYLKGLEITDPSRIGVAGASLGGELSVALGALETSIKAIAFSSYFGAGAFEAFGAGAIKQPHYCHLVPKIGSIMRKEDVFRLLAPRASIGIRDVPNEQRYSSTIKDLEKTWELYDRQQAFEFIKVVGGKHEFYVEQTIGFFKANL